MNSVNDVESKWLSIFVRAVKAYTIIKGRNDHIQMMR